MKLHHTVLVAFALATIPSIAGAQTPTLVMQWGAFDNPVDIAVEDSSKVYAVDISNQYHRVQVFRTDGTFLYRSDVFSLERVGPSNCSGDLDTGPFAVAPASGGIQYAAFNLGFNGNPSSALRGTLDGVISGGSFFDPDPSNQVVQLATGPNGVVFAGVLGTSNHILKLSSPNPYALALLTQWGSTGSGDGQFSSIQGIATDAAGDVYVADGSLGRIQKFDQNGGFLTKWGTGGSGPGEFGVSLDVAVDPQGRVYVMDGMNNRVQVFDHDGGFLFAWGMPGFIVGSVGKIAIASNGDIYLLFVNNQGTNMIQKWVLLATTAAPISPAPVGAELSKTAPNPFWQSTMIEFVLPSDAEVKLRVFDAAGRLIRILKDESLPAGRHRVAWDGRDASGGSVATGLYYYELEVNGARQTRTAIRLR